ncbi:MAG: Asp-tRNA(Asn)/Glu-tRNA(Gln) amidotransferase subunit GatB, partial [Candidatus Nitrosocosmicus sp.]
NINAERVSDQQVLTKFIHDILLEENHLIKESTVNPNIHNFILGKIMKKTSGRADPKLTLTLIKKAIEESVIN